MAQSYHKQTSLSIEKRNFCFRNLIEIISIAYRTFGSRKNPMRNLPISHRIFHFHRKRVISADINGCYAVDKEKISPKTVKKKRKLMKSQYFSVEVC